MVHPDYFDAETQSSRHLLQDCNDGIIRPPYTNVNTPSNSTLDVTTAQIEGYANFPLSQGPGKSHIPKDSIPMGFADIEGKIIHVGGTYETHKDGKIQAMSYINKFAEQDIAVDGCYPNGVYDGYDESGKVMCTCGVHGQYCSDDFLDTHEDLRHSGSYDSGASFSSFYHSGHEGNDFERRKAAGIPLSCNDWIIQNCGEDADDIVTGQGDTGGNDYRSGVGVCWDIAQEQCHEVCLTDAGRGANLCSNSDEVDEDEGDLISCENLVDDSGGWVENADGIDSGEWGDFVDGVGGDSSEFCEEGIWKGDNTFTLPDDDDTISDSVQTQCCGSG